MHADQHRFHNRNIRAPLALLLFAAIALVGGNALAAPASGPHLTLAHAGDPSTPANVPNGYVVTPAGYFHPSCVRQVAADEVVDMSDGWLRQANGSKRASTPCAFPRYTPNGARIDTALSARMATAGSIPNTQVSDGQQPATVITDDTLFVGPFDSYDGWIESISAHETVANSMSYMRANMFVPQAPLNTLPSTNFFFPGAQNLDQGLDFSTIIQPVLGWNGYSDLHAWTIASWNCCKEGNVYASDYKQVAVGDVIQGVMQGTNCSATTHICANWSIVTKDVTSGQSVTLNTEAFGQAFNWMFAAAFEVYGVTSCEDLSSTGHMDFTDILVKNVAGNAASPNWLTGWPNSSVVCDYGAYTITAGTAYQLTF